MPQVRVVGDEGEQLGVMDTRDAIRAARQQGLDLVEVAPGADPPVCRIIDFGKFQYEAKKKANEAKKKQVVIIVKEVKFRPSTDEHDYSYRMKRAREWLQIGDKVKATIWFRGREMTHRELGSRILAKLEKDVSDVGEVEARPRMEGNQMFIIFGPKRHKGGAKPDRPPAPQSQGAAGGAQGQSASPAPQGQDAAGSGQGQSPAPPAPPSQNQEAGGSKQPADATGQGSEPVVSGQ